MKKLSTEALIEKYIKDNLRIKIDPIGGVYNRDKQLKVKLLLKGEIISYEYIEVTSESKEK